MFIPTITSIESKRATCSYSIQVRTSVRQRKEVSQPIHPYRLLECTPAPGYRPHKPASIPIMVTTGVLSIQSEAGEPSSGSWLVFQPAACCEMSIFNLCCHAHCAYPFYFIYLPLPLQITVIFIIRLSMMLSYPHWCHNNILIVANENKIV